MMQAGLAYATWIQNRANVPANPAGMCREVAERMAKDFPNLKVGQSCGGWDTEGQ